MIWIQFVICAIVIIFAGDKLSRHADLIAERSSLGGLWVGSVLLAAATSLPELATSVSSSMMNIPDIAVGNVFGSNIFNLAIIFIMDLVYRQGSTLHVAEHGHIVSAFLGLVLSAIAVLSIVTQTHPQVWGVGLETIVIAGVYILGLRYMHNKVEGQPEPAQDRVETSLGPTYLKFAIAAAFIVVAGVGLSNSADQIAELTGLGRTFIGSLLVAFTTSLPELVASITAVRIGAINLAFGNILGSNIFNMIILLAADIAYTGSPILAVVEPVHAITALFGFIMSLLVIIGLTFRSERLRFLGMNPISWALFLAYLTGSYALYIQ